MSRHYEEIMKKTMNEVTVEDVLSSLLQHDCTTCGWMKPNLQPPKQGQKFCRYKDPVSGSTRITTSGTNACNMWKLEADPRKRYTGSWVDMSVVTGDKKK